MELKIFWSDGVASQEAKPGTLEEARRLWSDQIPARRGCFLGLTDSVGSTVQFYYDADGDEASGRIVLMDFPRPQERGSYSTHVTIAEVPRLLEKAFRSGTDPRHFSPLEFEAW